MQRAAAAGIAALFALLGSSEPPQLDAREQSTALLQQQLAQYEEIFGFDFAERIYDRGIATLESINTRLGVLIAAQAAIAIVLIDRVEEFGSWPGEAFLCLMAATSISYFVRDVPEIAKVGWFLHQFPRAPRRTRSAILEGFPAAVAYNERRIRFRGWVFNGSIFLTILVLAWALRQRKVTFGAPQK